MYQSVTLLSHPNLPANLKGIRVSKTLNLISLLIKQYGRKLISSFKGAAIGSRVFISWINKKLQEGAEIHNRSQRESDRRYANNFYHIRGVQ